MSILFIIKNDVGWDRWEVVEGISSNTILNNKDQIIKKCAKQ